MEEKLCEVTVKGVKRMYPQGTDMEQIARDFQYLYKDQIVLAFVDGKLQELHRELNKDVLLDFVTTGDSIGMKTYKRSINLLLVKSIYDISGHDQIRTVRIRHSVSKGYYCTVEGNVSVNEEFLARVKERMQDLVKQQLPIKKRTVTTDEAIALFHKHGMYAKEKLFRFRRSSNVNIYSLNEFEDYYYGYMVSNTSYLQYFDLYLYDQGFVIQMPTKDDPKRVSDFRPQEKLCRVLRESEKWADMLHVPVVGELNEEVIRQGVNDLILVQEALQEKKIAEIAQKIVESEKVKFVLIAGPSSSGKTTFSHRLSIQLRANGMTPHPIAVDNYFKNRTETPLDENGNYDFECLEAIDVEKFNEDMSKLLKGEEVELPVFNFKTGIREYRGDKKKLGEQDVLVIEGIHGLNDALTYALDANSKFKIYISALTQIHIDEHNRIPTTDGRLLRRIVRDARTRGTGARDTIRMWPSVRRGEERNIFPYQEQADVMFNSALIYEMAVLKVYAEPALFGIPKDCPEYAEAKRLLKFLDYFLPIDSRDIPQNSLLREFIGGGCFKI